MKGITSRFGEEQGLEYLVYLFDHDEQPDRL